MINRFLYLWANIIRTTWIIYFVLYKYFVVVNIFGNVKWMSNNSTRNVYLEYKLSSNPVIWHKQDANLEMLATTTYTWCFTTIKLVFYVSIVLSNKYLVIISKYIFLWGNGVKLTIGKIFGFFFYSSKFILSVLF